MAEATSLSPVDRRSRRGTWSLIAVGFSVLLLVLVTIAVGMQSYVVTQTFKSGQALTVLDQQMLDLRRVQVALATAEQARTQALATGKQEDLGRFRASLAQMLALSLPASLRDSEANLQIQAAARLDGVSEAAGGIAALGKMADEQYQDLAARHEAAASAWSTWQKRVFHLVFLTNNLTMLLLITGGGLLLLYVGWHLDARQKLLEARQAVLKAERDRASFVAAAGHDLRQPLQAISLFLTTLTHRAEDPETKTLLLKIAQATTSMRRMINGLLDVAKLDAGLVSADQMDQPLADIFAGLREEFERQAEAKGLVLVVDPTDAVVHTDPLLVESILRNLLANAINYTNHGHVSMSARLNGRRVVITVRDTGPGIAADEIDLVFRDFYRVSGSGGGGLGLGLGIVQRMAKLIYAQVAVDSTVGLGTRFTVAVSAGASVPVPAVTYASSAPSLSRQGGAGTILLVDDNDPLRIALSGQLAAWGIEVLEASGLPAACEVARTTPKPVELAIVDYDLGMGHTGLELLHRLSALEGRRVAGLIITGSGDPDVHRVLSRSGYEWLQKPFDAEVLRDAITRLRAPVA